MTTLGVLLVVIGATAIIATTSSPTGTLASPLVAGSPFSVQAGPPRLPAEFGESSPVGCTGGGGCFYLTRHSPTDQVVIFPWSGAIEPVVLPPGIKLLDAAECPTDRRCYGVGIAPSRRWSLLTSTDAGRSWRSVTEPPGPLSSLPPSVDCPTASHCVVVQDVGPPGNIHVDSGVSTDGGRTWAFNQFAAPFRFGFGLACSSAQACLAVVGWGTGLISTVVMTSGDGGRTWHPEFGAPARVAGVECARTLCWAVAYPPGIATATAWDLYRSDDGGRNWSLADLASSGVSLVHGPLCSSTEDCTAVGLLAQTSKPAFVTTSDGGQVWQLHRATSPASLAALTGPLTCTSNDRCFGIGPEVSAEQSAFAWTADPEA